MYQEWANNQDLTVASLSTYRNVFNSLNIKFFKPKKDLCDLCATANPAFPNEETEMERENRNTLQSRWEEHISEKNIVREQKKDDKECAKVNGGWLLLYLT